MDFGISNICDIIKIKTRQDWKYFKKSILKVTIIIKLLQHLAHTLSKEELKHKLIFHHQSEIFLN